MKIKAIQVKMDEWYCARVQCKFKTRWSYRDLATRGNPVCPKCDTELMWNDPAEKR